MALRNTKSTLPAWLLGSILLTFPLEAAVVTVQESVQIDAQNPFPRDGLLILDGETQPVTVTVRAGGEIATATGDRSAAFGQSSLVLEGGRIGGPLALHEQAAFRLLAGEFQFPLDDPFRFDALPAIVEVHDQATAEFQAGVLDLYGQFLPFGHGILADGGSQVTIAGGLFTSWNGHVVQVRDRASLQISGGRLVSDDAHAVWAAGQAQVDVSGGEIIGGEGGAAFFLTDNAQLTVQAAQLSNEEGAGILARDNTHASVAHALIAVRDSAAVVALDGSHVTVVSATLYADHSVASVSGEATLRLVDSRGADRDFHALRAFQQGHLQLIGNEIVASDGAGLSVLGHATVDFQSGGLIVYEGHGIVISEDGSLHWRGGWIERRDEALVDNYDVAVSGRGNLHVYALRPEFRQGRLTGTFRDGTPLDGVIDLGADARLILHDLAHTDYRADGVLDSLDLDDFGRRVRAASPRFEQADDLNDDGRLDDDDFTTLLRTYWGTDFGDANLDGYFDSTDLVTVFTKGLYDASQLAGWASGDWNQDTRFDSRDLILAFQTGNYLASHGLPPERRAVPEPAGAVPYLLAMVIFRRWVRQTE